MEELRVARDYLRTEGERVRSINARYAHLTRTASALVKVIAESMGKWRVTEIGSQVATSLAPRQPPSSGHSFSLAAPHPCRQGRRHRRGCRFRGPCERAVLLATSAARPRSTKSKRSKCQIASADTAPSRRSRRRSNRPASA